MRTSRGILEIGEKGFELSERNVRTLFCLGLALKTCKDEVLLGYSKKDILKISNWIWCLLFEWSVENSQNLITFYVDSEGTDHKSWCHTLACMKLDLSPHSLIIPLPILSRRANSLICQKSGQRTSLPLVATVGSFRENEDKEAIRLLSLSKTAPKWAIHNPYESFPFKPNSADEADAWRQGRGEFGGDDNYSRTMNGAQWQHATCG